MDSSKKIILVIIHSSLGELHWILPFITYLKENQETYEVVTLFFSNKVFESAKNEGTLFELLKQNSKVIRKNQLLSFLLGDSTRISYIFKDFWPITHKSLATSIKNVCSKAQLILYPHAYALYSLSTAFGTYLHNPKKHEESAYDGLVLNSAYDINYWSERILHDRIKVLGPLGYSDWWQRKITSGTKEVIDKEKVATRKFSHVIAFIIRGVNDDYLFEKDYDRLMSEAIAAFKDRQDTFIYIKPHPRQETSEVERYLHLLPPERYKVVNYNTFVLGSLADFSVCFWSSAITDILAVGIPTIEYFSFNGSCKAWIRTKTDEQTSFFDKLGLTLQARDKDTFEKALDKMYGNLEEIRSSQLSNFNQVFGGREASGQKMIQLLTEGIGSKKSISLVTRLKSYVHVLLATVKSSW